MLGALAFALTTFVVLTVLITGATLRIRALLPREHSARARLLSWSENAPVYAGLLVRWAGTILFWGVVAFFALLTIIYS